MSSLPPASESPWLIRHAIPADAEGMARVHILSWQHAYQGLLPQAMLDSLSLETRTRQWGEWIANPAAHHNLVSLQAGTIVGFISGGALRGDFAGFDCETAAIYLLPEVSGQGLGRILFRRMQQILREQGFAQMLVWVLASNQAARGFYERLGGVEALSQRILLGASFSSEPSEVDELGYAFDLISDPCHPC